MHMQHVQPGSTKATVISVEEHDYISLTATGSSMRSVCMLQSVAMGYWVGGMVGMGFARHKFTDGPAKCTLWIYGMNECFRIISLVRIHFIQGTARTYILDKMLKAAVAKTLHRNILYRQ